MHYSQLVAQIEKTKKNLWQYGAPWQRLRLDARSHSVFLTHRENYAQKDSWRGIDKSPFIVRRDNTALLPFGEISGTFLGTLGIAGRFSSRAGRITRYTYLHDCTDVYESLPGLLLDFSTGKPLNAKLFKELKYDKAAKEKVDARIIELKRAYLIMPRLKGVTFKREWQSISELYRDDRERDKIIIALLTRRHPTWSEDMTNILRWSAARYPQDKKKPKVANDHGWEDFPEDMTPAGLFDRAMEFHKTAVYRHFKAII